jgi:hypothetical protein
MASQGDRRERTFKLVISEEEHSMLVTMAASDGLSAASFLRQRIRAEWWQRNREHLGVKGVLARMKKPGSA